MPEAPVRLVPYDPEWPRAFARERRFLEELLWHERLAFRDLLRSHPSVAQQYADLKIDLARQYAFDREAYTVAKYPFIQRVLADGSIG